MINVDLLIKDNEGRTLLVWRKDKYGSGWHIPGGIIRFKETTEQRIHEVAWQELGATVEFQDAPIAIRQVIVPDRNERGHFISLLYRCQLQSPPDRAREYISGKPSNGQWKWHEIYPDDMLQVHNMYRDFIEGKDDCDEPVTNGTSFES
jgi:ADP-ribose pyrophosphatase YjhB (NUDIX family)